MSIEIKNRLFVPMATDSFVDFRDRGKEIELRKYGRVFTEKNVYNGRIVELRLGYSGHQSIWGTIGMVVVGSLPEIFEKFELVRLEPRFMSKSEAIENNVLMSGKGESFVAFEVIRRRLENRS